MIVVDAGVVVACVCDHPLHARAQGLFAEDPDWLAPQLWQAEVRNVIGQKLCRLAKLITEEEAIEAYQDALTLLQTGTRTVDPLACLKISLRYGLSGYDAEYVALAKQEGLTLVTTDKAMVKKLNEAGDRAVRLLE